MRKLLRYPPTICGEWEKGTWSIRPWIPGKSICDAWERHRSRTTLPGIREIGSAALALDYLHESGWVHGNIRPDHLIIGKAPGEELKATLIGLSVAQGKHVSSDYEFPYPGYSIQCEAPEIAEAAISGGEIEPTEASDIYALGASFLISATGQRPVDYPEDAPHDRQREITATRDHQPVRIQGAFGQLIRAMIQRTPDERPTAADVAAEAASWST
ncbi:protein kinase domain-containing protein [Streptomyces parvus]|uniref:Protein kinase family protein n=1 Tax=Streptomyces parvus TaxID=66428 RepID=A0A7K3RTE3_9ACTN|nr:protein kinase family protein [Streptomyces parvus]NEC18427.1 protein kinase family protein [Streptomyces parvus]